MAHVEKYTRGAMGNMLAHYNRKKASSKSLIDPARTPLNYNLANTDQPLSQLDFIHKRLSEIKVLNRKDVNVFCDWIVTAPQELSENEYADFFRDPWRFVPDGRRSDHGGAGPGLCLADGDHCWNGDSCTGTGNRKFVQ